MLCDNYFFINLIHLFQFPLLFHTSCSLIISEFCVPLMSSVFGAKLHFCTLELTRECAPVVDVGIVVWSVED